MNENTAIYVLRVRLSQNPDTKVEIDEQGVKGEVNISSDGRKFVLLEIADKSNFRKFHKRNLIYSSNDKGIWPALTPKEMMRVLEESERKGTPITLQGRVVTHLVEKYEIDGREVNTYSTIVLSDENEVTVFNSSKHPIIDAEGTLLVPVKKDRVDVNVVM